LPDPQGLVSVRLTALTEKPGQPRGRDDLPLSSDKEWKAEHSMGWTYCQTCGDVTDNGDRCEDCEKEDKSD
jgi:hypothetical protein